MITRHQSLRFTKEERSHVLSQYWRQGYKIVGYVGSTSHKVPWKTPIRRRLRRKDAQRMMASLVKSDPSLRYQLKLEQTLIGWVPMCKCEKICTHKSPVFDIRAALEVHLDQAEDKKWCARHHWWWEKTSYDWVPSHNSLEPCGDRARIPRPLEKVLAGWAGEISPNQPQGSMKDFSLTELREFIMRYLPADRQDRDDRVDDFLLDIVTRKLDLPYWCDFEMDKNGRLTDSPKGKLSVYLKRAVYYFGIDSVRHEVTNKKIEAQFQEKLKVATEHPSLEDLLLSREETKSKHARDELFFSKLGAYTGRPAEEIRTLIEVRKIQDIKTLAEELGVERTKFSRKVAYPARKEAD